MDKMPLIQSQIPKRLSMIFDNPVQRGEGMTGNFSEAIHTVLF